MKVQMQQSLISTTTILLLVLSLAFYPTTPSAQLSPIQPPTSSPPTPPLPQHSPPSPSDTCPPALTKKGLPKDLKVSLKPGEGGEGGGEAGGFGGGGVLVSAAGTVRLLMWVNVVVVVGVALFGGATV